jgi:hypothetical protein
VGITGLIEPIRGKNTVMDLLKALSYKARKTHC